MKREMICINCPRGCHLTVDDEKLTVEGNFCPRGKTYGINEVTHPMRTLTSTAYVKNGTIDRVSVKSDKPIPKELMFKVMDEINKIRLNAPVTIGDILIENVLDTGSNIIATKSVGKAYE